MVRKTKAKNIIEFVVLNRRKKLLTHGNVKAKMLKSLVKDYGTKGRSIILKKVAIRTHLKNLKKRG